MLDTKFWAKYFEVYDVLNLLIPYQELLRDICDELEIKKGEKILEAGCGTGNLALEIKKRGGDVVGLDNCREALDIYKKKDPNAEVVLADLTQKLPFPDNYFDKITSNNTLYTILRKKQLAIVKEFYRVLKPGGMVVVSNLMEGWSPVRIYIVGIKENFQKQGFFKSITKFFRMIIPTIKIFYYNNLIRKESEYYFCSFSEQKKLLEEARFSRVSSTKKSYADQSIINSAVRYDIIK